MEERLALERCECVIGDRKRVVVYSYRGDRSSANTLWYIYERERESIYGVWGACYFQFRGERKDMRGRERDTLGNRQNAMRWALINGTPVAVQLQCDLAEPGLHTYTYIGGRRGPPVFVGSDKALTRVTP